MRETNRQGKIVEYQTTGKWPGWEKKKGKPQTVAWSNKLEVKVQSSYQCCGFGSFHPDPQHWFFLSKIKFLLFYYLPARLWFASVLRF